MYSNGVNSFMVPGTKVVPFPYLIWEAVFTACVVFSFLLFSFLADVHRGKSALCAKQSMHLKEHALICTCVRVFALALAVEVVSCADWRMAARARSRSSPLCWQ